MTKLLKYQLLSILFCFAAVNATGQTITQVTKTATVTTQTTNQATLVKTLTIDDALDIAEENNPALKQTKLSLERTQQLLIASKAGLKSQFSLTVNPIDYSKNRMYDTRVGEWYTNESFNSGGSFQVQQPILLTDGVLSLTNNFSWRNSYSETAAGNNSSKRFVNDLNLRLSQPLFTYNTRKMRLKQLEFDNENAGIRYALQRLNLEQSITTQFYAVYSAQNELNTSQEALKNSEQNYAIVKDKVEADMFRKEELYQSELTLAKDRSAVESQMVELENAKDALKQTLGMPLDEDINVKADIQPSEVTIDLLHAVQNGLERRMELRQREIEEELGEMTMITVKDENKFKGTMALSVGITGDNEALGNIYDTPTQNPRVQISFSIPIFDWGERKARINAQKATQTITKLQHEDQKISIELEIRQTWRNIENLRNQIAIDLKNIDNAQLTYDLNLIRYREGELTGLQISQYQTQLYNAKSSYTSTLIRYKQQVLRLKILALYDYEKDIPVVPAINLNNN
ncbi:MAG: TolC family protein [Tannerella sp.]|jgi:outer membrane protein TolC|nr:TolC family protein [Tannerella sp.]